MKPSWLAETRNVPMSVEVGVYRVTVAASATVALVETATPNWNVAAGLAKVSVRTPPVPPSSDGSWVYAVTPGPPES